MTHRQNDMQERDESQVTFATLLREKVQQAVRTALISVLEAEVDAFIGAVRYERSDKIIAMGITAGAWIRAWGTSTICRYRARGQALKRSGLSAIIAAEVSWIKASGRGLSVG